MKRDSMVRYLFGPVPSRRLGMSLGVDLVPKKICSLDCVYCEVGKTTALTTKRREYIKSHKLKDELTHYFEHNPDPDFITFSGSGEPTLNSQMAEIIDFIKDLKPDVPMAVLTNGTLLFEKEIRHILQKADIVLPSLDAATQRGFEKINRPAKELQIETIIQGLIDFRMEFSGEIWLEIFILPGYNDTAEELAALKEAILNIQPNRVQLNTLDRPGAIPGLKAAPREQLQQILDNWKLDNAEIIAAAPERKAIQSYRQDTESIILGTIARRPCTIDDLSKFLGLHPNEINKYLAVLENDGKIIGEQQERGLFYRSPGER